LKGCEASSLPLPQQLQLVEHGNHVGAVWLAIMKQDPTARYWKEFEVANLTAERVQEKAAMPAGRSEPLPEELLAAMVAIKDEHDSREWEKTVSTVGRPWRSGEGANDIQFGQLQWRVRWLWVLAQYGSSAARSSLCHIAPSVLGVLRTRDLPLAWGVALEYLMTAPPEGAARSECEDLLSRASGHSEFHNLLMTWEGGQRIVPYVRATGNYTPVMRELVHEAAARKNRMLRQLATDLRTWKQQGDVSAGVWATIVEDAGFSEADL
jgi:hypothetical protein